MHLRNPELDLSRAIRCTDSDFRSDGSVWSSISRPVTLRAWLSAEVRLLADLVGFRDAALGLAVHELPATADGWLSEALFAVDEPVQIEGPKFTLVRDGENWLLEAEAPEGKVLSVAEAEAPAGELAGLRITVVADADEAGVAPQARLHRGNSGG